MKRAIGLITGGAGGAGNAQDPSRTIASERALNGAIVATDISQTFEQYLEIFDHFYAEDIEGTTDTMKEPVHGKAAVRARLAGFLIPLHVFAEIGGVSVSIQSSPIISTGRISMSQRWRTCSATRTRIPFIELSERGEGRHPPS